MFFTVFAFVLLILSLIHYKTRYSTKGRLIDKLPGDYAYPIIGNSYDYITDADSIFVLMRKEHAKYERFCRNWFLWTPIVSLYDPNDVQVLLSHPKNIEKSVFYSLTEAWLGDGLLLSKGSKWHQRRKILTPAFHFNILQKFCRIFAEQNNILAAELNNVVGQEVDLLSYIGRSVLNTLCETTMGIKTGQDGDSNVIYRKAVNEAGKQIIYRSVRPWLHVPFIYFRSKAGKEHLKTVTTLHNFTLNVIRLKRSQQSFKETEDDVSDDFYFNKRERLAMLDLLLLMESKGEIDEEGIQHEVDTFMFEGHDTISLALTYTLMIIANHTDIQAKVYDEIIQVFGDTPIEEGTIETYQQMKYLECVLKETQRLYPSVTLISRKITSDLELKDYTIPTGTICEIHIYDLHRNSEIYDNPEQFDPDRFLPENYEKLHPFAYVPFSAGSRNCIGQRYAMLEMKCMVASILKNFELIAVTKPEDLVFTVDLVLRSKVPVKVIFNRRG